MDYAAAEKLMSSYRRVADALDEATEMVGTLPNEEEQKNLRRPLAKIMVAVWTELMRPLITEHPELDPDKDVEPDAPLTDEEKARVAQFTESEIREIDEILLSNATARFRKVAMIVALTMSQLQQLGKRVHGVPDVFYAQRVQSLVEGGRLEAQGNLAYMRFSEVRLPGPPSGAK